MMWLAFLINLTAYPISSGLLPYVAREILLVDATGLGWLAASFALGSLLGSIATVATGGPRRLARSVIFGAWARACWRWSSRASFRASR